VSDPRSGKLKRSPAKSQADSQLQVVEHAPPAGQVHEHIARRAYVLYEVSGYRGEDALQHWLEAEREVRNNHKDDSTREN